MKQFAYAKQRAVHGMSCSYVNNRKKVCIKVEVYNMASVTNLNIRTEKAVKEAAENIFAELGLNMTTAVNMFLRQTIRENGIPFSLKLNTPNEITMAAIEEGRRIAADPNVKGYKSLSDLKEALDDI